MKKALIVIDLQKGFLTKYTRGLPSKIRRFIQKRENEYDSIIFTQFRNLPKSNFVRHLNYRDLMSRNRYDIVNELRGLVKKTNLFEKDTYSSFVTKKLPGALRRSGIKEVHIIGIDTENCVLTFARDAFDRGYKVVVLKNLCRSHSDPKLHRAALEIIRNNIGEVK